MKHEDSSLPATVADMAALGQLFEEHRPRLLAMVQRRLDPALHARIDAEDILSEAFLEACRKWHSYKEQTVLSAYAWLYRLVLDCLIQAWRRENRACRDPKREMPWPERSSVQLGLSLIHPGSSPSSAAARAEFDQHVRQALERLELKDQEVLWMHHFDRLTFREMAQVLGVQESAVTMRHVRALRRLKDVWQQLHGEGGSHP